MTAARSGPIDYSIRTKGETLTHATAATPAVPAWSGTGRPPTRANHPDDAISLDGSLPERWLIAEWPDTVTSWLGRG